MVNVVKRPWVPTWLRAPADVHVQQLERCQVGLHSCCMMLVDGIWLCCETGAQQLVQLST